MPCTPSAPRTPKIGNVRAQWGQHSGRRVLLLEPDLHLVHSAIALPEVLTPLLTLCDGTRDLNGLRASLMVRAGIQLSEDTLTQIIQQMDEALLFENGRQAEAVAQATAAYRGGDSRAPVSAGISYPVDPTEARQMLDRMMQREASQIAGMELPRPAECIRGVVSPHIDYPRGGPTYARLWGLARPALEGADLVVILGTDHHGPAGTITLTGQHYRTPWGTLRTDGPALEALMDTIGAESALAHELHHTTEHSVELAAVWAHYIAPEANFTVLPILCGSFAEFIDGSDSVDDHAVIEKVVSGLRVLVGSSRRVMLVAAADLAHIGPAFGGTRAGPIDRADCSAKDAYLLDCVARGSAPDFLASIQREGDRRNVCGVPPLYLFLKSLEPSTGLVTSYEQCPADGQGTSLVSIAGVVVW